jgi:hypothetical protein
VVRAGRGEPGAVGGRVGLELGGLLHQGVQKRAVVRADLVDRPGQFRQPGLDRGQPQLQLAGRREGHHRQRPVGLQIGESGGHPAGPALGDVTTQQQEA